MTSAIPNPINMAIFPVAAQAERTEQTELVRGNEQELLVRFLPVVREQSVTLDLGSVRRIDAAGIAALISLHAAAHEAGHLFTVANPTPHVAEILRLVGLERILLSHYAVENSHSDSCFEYPAA
jgi:anti-anti-sigma regulatory factor